jgi:hypothetical protein
MTKQKISIALAALATIAGAQTPAAMEDAAARQQAAAATAASVENKEKIEAVEGKLEGLNESYLETKSTVDALKKLKISGLIQAQAVFYPDTNVLSSARPTQQTQFLVRRGRLKATYDAGNGSTFVTQYDIKQSGLTPQDIYVKFDEPWLKTFSLQAGLQDIPFGFEIGYSSSTMEYLERSRFERNAMFKDEKDVGVILGASPKVPGLDALNVKLALLNGTGVTDGVFDPKCFVGRVNLAKNLYDLGLGVNFGASYYMDSRLNQVAAVRNKANTSDSIPSNYFEIDGSASFKKVGFRKEIDANIIGSDLQVTYDNSFIPSFAGLKVMGELYTGSAIGTAGGNTRSILPADVLYKRNVLGYNVSLVQNIDKIAQLVVRYDVYDPNTDVSGNQIGDKTANAGKGNGTSKTDLEYDSWYFGINVFLNGNTKLALGYDLVSNETSKNLAGSTPLVPVTNFSKDVGDDIVTARLQFAF